LVLGVARAPTVTGCRGGVHNLSSLERKEKKDGHEKVGKERTYRIVWRGNRIGGAVSRGGKRYVERKRDVKVKACAFGSAAVEVRRGAILKKSVRFREK